MKRAIGSVCAAALLISACGGANDANGNGPIYSVHPSTGAGSGQPDAGGSGQLAGDGDLTPGGDGDIPNGGDGDLNGGGPPLGDGGQVTGDGDAATGGGAVTTGDGDMVTPSGSAPKLPTPSMTCPDLKSGTQTIMGRETQIWAGTPSANGTGPLLIYWHGTGSSPIEVTGLLPQQMRDEILAQGGMIVAAHSDQSVQDGQDVTFVLKVWYTTHDEGFSDLIAACAVQKYGIDPRRIHTTGCSAGGLMAGTMSLERSSYLASVSTNSGGVAAPNVFHLQDPNHVPAVMLMHGGSTDTVFNTNFQTTSGYLSDQLRAAGGFVINCNHMNGHCGAPPDLQLAAWQFMKDHPFGIAESPYAKTGLPSSFPSYCQIVK